MISLNQPQVTSAIDNPMSLAAGTVRIRNVMQYGGSANAYNYETPQVSQNGYDLEMGGLRSLETGTNPEGLMEKLERIKPGCWVSWKAKAKGSTRYLKCLSIKRDASGTIISIKGIDRESRRLQSVNMERIGEVFDPKEWIDFCKSEEETDFPIYHPPQFSSPAIQTIADGPFMHTNRFSF
jgi:hypothetical protein